jgi:hypothetical protein
MWLYSYLNSFEGIEKIYNAITPLRGQRKEHDIRPLQKRSKWWERIIKVDDNTYVLADGWVSYSYGKPNAPEEVKAEDLDRVLTLSPIVWQRRADGDYVQIRSNVNRSSSWSRYKFLDTFLPAKLPHGFDSSGVHWISHQGQKYVLPKGIRKYDYNPKTKQHELIEREDRYLEFKHVGGDAYVLSHGGYTKTVPIVNREVTKQYNKKIRELWDYARVILPVFGYTLHDQVREKRETLNLDWRGVHGLQPSVVRGLLDDPDVYAEQRLAFCVLAAVDIDASEARYVINTHGKHTWKSPDGYMFCEHEKSYDRFRRLVQRVGGMLTTKEVEI